MQNAMSILLVADAHKARIFERVGNETKFKLHPISELSAELDTNHEKPTRTFNSTGSIRHGVEPHTDRREVERHRFAQKIADNLSELAKEKPYDDLILVASHHIYDELDKVMSDNLKQKISHKLTKDLVKFTVEEIKQHLTDLKN